MGWGLNGYSNLDRDAGEQRYVPAQFFRSPANVERLPRGPPSRARFYRAPER
jgi:hypothetical protein